MGKNARDILQLLKVGGMLSFAKFNFLVRFYFLEMFVQTKLMLIVFMIL